MQLLWSVFFLFWGVLLGCALLQWSVPWGFLIGLPLGYVGSFLATRGLLLVLVAVFPNRPKCLRGLCSRLDYELVDPRSDPWVWRCKCDDSYVRDGKRFMQIEPDGTRRPYKKLNSLRFWVDDANIRQK